MASHQEGSPRSQKASSVPWAPPHALPPSGPLSQSPACPRPCLAQGHGPTETRRMGDKGPGTRGRRCVHDPIKYLRKDWPEVRGPRATTAPLVSPAGARLHSLPRGTPARAPSSCQASPTATPGAHLPLPSALPLPMVPLSTPTRRNCPHLRTPETHTLRRGPPLSLHPLQPGGHLPALRPRPAGPERPAESRSADGLPLPPVPP